MKRVILAGAALFSMLILAACGGGGEDHREPPTIVTQILSDSAFDGDIAQDPLTGAFTVTQGSTQSVFAGIDPDTGEEFRAFLDFPLTGADGVPGDAAIVSATLDIVINSILPQPLIGTIPIRIDLVNFQPPTLIGTDFSRTIQPALASTTVIPPIDQLDLNGHVPVDVTVLMREAQRFGLANFQIRILMDFDAVADGLIEINDTTGPNRRILAPVLQVAYF
ncbi:MAG: hypothetical protein ACYC5X_11760 [Syntrophales bacterium]